MPHGEAQPIARSSAARVGIDGVDGAGKTTSADELRNLGHPTERLHVDDFFNPPEVRYRLGRHSSEGFWLDSYDHESLGLAVGQKRATILIVDGLFVHRDELVALWNYSVFLDVSFDISVPRMVARDGTNPDPSHASQHRSVEGQKIYFRECSPWDRATLVIDNSNLSAPHIRF